MDPSPSEMGNETEMLDPVQMLQREENLKGSFRNISIIMNAHCDIL